jgi:uncharacterized protein (TIGR00369 family)
MPELLNAQVATKIVSEFESQKFLNHLGVKVTDVAKGTCAIEIPYEDFWSLQEGVFHHGVVGALADAVASATVATVSPGEGKSRTAEYKFNILSPAEGDRLVAEGAVIKAGRTLQVVEANIYVIKGSEKKHCAMALMTLVSTN